MEVGRAKREDLAALRIDRDAVQLRKSGGWKKPAAVIAALLAALLVGVIGWRATLGRVPSVQIGYAARAEGGGATSGATVLTGSGYVVTGERYISLGVRVPSRIDHYLVEEGERVAKDQPLVQLDDRQYRAALDQARANLLRANANVDLDRKELERARALFDRSVFSKADLDVKENELRVAEAEVAQLAAAVKRAEVDLEDTVIRAPTAGVILEKFKEVGEIAVPGGFAGSGELIRMANLDDMRAEVDVNESELARIRLGQPAEVRPDAYPDRTYPARVVKLYPQINRQKGTLKVEVRIEQVDEQLRPDMSVRIAFLEDAKPADATSGEVPAVVLAPRAAVKVDGGASYAWVVTEGVLRKQALVLGGERGDQVVVTSGLAGGEALVVTSDSEELREGQKVEPR